MEQIDHVSWQCYLSAWQKDIDFEVFGYLKESLNTSVTFKETIAAAADSIK